uniref:phosphoserine phosphatase n=1 Tax=Rhodosorus marinus TaxID=101924 RepID=A0A7S2ZSY7_9RHOD|mmetsp:Transcript_31554/g.122206  ORF Transcript_31554/g.122206 Transcript_31554/m.122206 type:complete len:385 (+) Transcript_31554:95-1249(+)
MGEYGEQGERERRLIATISGKRTSAGLPSVLEALEKAKAALVDIRQFIVQDEFTLTLVIELSDEEGQRETDIVKELLLCAHAMKLFVEFDVVQNRVVSEPGQVFVITMISPVGTASSAFLVDICQVIATYNGNIETITSLSRGSNGFISYEFSVRLPEEDLFRQLEKMREGLLLLGKRARGDIAIQRSGLLQRAKRMVVFDLSYTLISSDANDILFKSAGVEESEEMPKRAKPDISDYAEQLEQRVSRLKGLQVSQVLAKALSELSYTPGAIEVVRTLKRLGYKTAVISRGPRLIADAVKTTLGLDFAYGNEFLVEGEKFTGELRTPAVDARRKRDLLDMLLMHEKITTEQVIAVGDGPVSSKMLSHAGLAVAFDQVRDTKSIG